MKPTLVNTRNRTEGLQSSRAFKNMAMLALSLTCVLLVCGVGTVTVQRVPCGSTYEACTRGGFSSVSVFNNNVLCCLPGYSMSMINNDCQCTKTSDAVQCVKGPVACRTSDGSGNTHCCPPGYPSMQSQATAVNGMMLHSCTCSRPSQGGASSVQMISSNGQGIVSSGINSSFQGWSQMFGQRMQKMMQALRDQLQAMRNFPSWLQG